jgi:glutathione-specific gamma-glutamylcyclotransferase
MWWNTPETDLHNTVAHLEEQGIRDRNLWRLQAFVADRIKPASGSQAGNVAPMIP